MRGAFIRTLLDVAVEDDKVMLITGDLGFSVIEPFAEKFPDRFINAGVAEQNMVGVATGLAEAGFIPFVYSIVTFASLRPYEFIRNGPVLHDLPVRIVGVGGGFEYGDAGPTHHGVEDVAIMRTHQGLTVLCPADAEQTAAAVLDTWNMPGPIYLRLGKDDRTMVAGLDGRFELGRAQTLREGNDLLLITMGAIATETLAAANALADRGVQATVLLVSSFNPSPEADVSAALTRCPLALTVEAHSVAGGLGSFVAEVAADQGLGKRVIRCGVRGFPEGAGGSERYLFQKHGLTAEQIAATAERSIAEVQG